MAKKVTVELVDDMSPDQIAAETVPFGLDGSTYEIDLSEKNAAKLRADMQKYIDAGRRTGRAPRSSGAVRVAAREDLDAIRTWAQSKGKKVANRGRIAHEVIADYDAEQAKPTAPKVAAKKAPATTPAAAKESAPTDEKQPAFSG